MTILAESLDKVLADIPDIDKETTTSALCHVRVYDELVQRAFVDLDEAEWHMKEVLRVRCDVDQYTAESSGA